MEAFLLALLPRHLPRDRSFVVHPFQGKGDLLTKLPQRLLGYATWLPEDWRILVVVDRDEDDCHELKQQLEMAARQAGLRSRSAAGALPWQVVNRIAIEELEAWYFGDWTAVRAAYPRVPGSIPKRAAHRDPDAVQGGTWQAFERVLQRHGYFRTGLPKIEVADTLGALVDPARSNSRSFRCFWEALAEAVA